MKVWLKARDSADVARFYDDHYRGLKLEDRPFERDWSFFWELLPKVFKSTFKLSRFLDAGCGSGQFLEFMVRRHVAQYVGIDISRNALEIADQRLDEDAELYQMEMERACDRWDDYFDVVTCWGAIEHTMDPNVSLAALLKTLHPQGALFLMVPMEFEDCLRYVAREPNDVTNERFAAREEWIEYFSPVARPFLVDEVKGDEYSDLVLAFRKEGFQ